MDLGGPNDAQVKSYLAGGANVHIGAIWRIRLNHPSAAAMRLYVKLLLPLVTDFYRLVSVLLPNIQCQNTDPPLGLLTEEELLPLWLFSATATYINILHKLCLFIE